MKIKKIKNIIIFIFEIRKLMVIIFIILKKNLFLILFFWGGDFI